MDATGGSSHPTGYYNNGVVYAFGRRYLDTSPFTTHDRVGLEIDLNTGMAVVWLSQVSKGTVKLFLNGEKVSDEIHGLTGIHYPCLIFANNVKCTVTISSRTDTLLNVSEDNTLQQLHDMGFTDDEKNRAMLQQHRGDLAAVVSGLLSEQEKSS